MAENNFLNYKGKPLVRAGKKFSTVIWRMPML